MPYAIYENDNGERTAIEFHREAHDTGPSTLVGVATNEKTAQEIVDRGE